MLSIFRMGSSAKVTGLRAKIRTQDLLHKEQGYYDNQLDNSYMNAVSSVLLYIKISAHHISCLSYNHL
jgi:hypothetical protein